MTKNEAMHELGLAPESVLPYKEALERMLENFVWRIEFQCGEESLRQARRGFEACNVLIPLAPSVRDGVGGELLPDLRFA